VISDQEYEAATRRGQETFENVPHGVEATYVPSIGRVLLLLSDGMELSLRTKDYSWMAKASPEELKLIELNASGLEIYFPKLDEGFWIPDLLEHLLGVRKFLKKKADEEMAEYTNKHVAV